MTLARDRQGLALSSRYARQFDPRLLIGYLQLTYTCAYTCTHIYKNPQALRLSATSRRATRYVPATCSDLKIKKPQKVA